MRGYPTPSQLLALTLLLSSSLLDAAPAKVILIDDEDPGCRLIGTWADNYGNNPEGKNFSGDGTVKNRYHYTSSHGKFARTGKERAIYTPQLPEAGTYKVEVGFRGSENRSPRVTYEVTSLEGKSRKTISQRTDGNWADLGVFSFAAGTEGTVAMVSDGGLSASVDAVRFTFVAKGDKPSADTTPGQTTGGLGDLVSTPPSNDAPGVANGAQIIRLDHRNPGRKAFLFPADGVVRITPYLQTYGPAHLSVSIKRASGAEETFVSWSRASDTDPAPLEVNGKAVPDSMREVKPGDYSPAPPQAHEFTGKAGDEVSLQLEGEFGAGRPFLRMEFRPQ